MKHFLFALSITLAFIVGCVTNQRVVPPATAQTPITAPEGVPIWEHRCTTARSMFFEDALLDALGKQGWEMVGVTASADSTSRTGTGSRLTACFKRPRT